MSRVGKLPVAIPEGVNVDLKDDRITVKGKGGELSTAITGLVNVSVNDGEIVVQPANDTKRSRAMWGTTRSNIQNLVQGVTEGFSKRLEIQGVGFRAAVQNDVLTLALGYSHDIKYIIPQGITIKAEKPTTLLISGADKQQVGQVAAEIRELRKPEPYKGKGVRFEDERIHMKEGKKK
jgi:large subunit ribosomal protein L6